MSQMPKPLSRAHREAVAGKTYVLLGASSGLGRGVALKLATAGVNLVIAARRTEALNDVARQATEAGSQVSVVTTDISQPKDVQYLSEEAVRQFGTVDVSVVVVHDLITDKYVKHYREHSASKTDQSSSAA